MGKRIVISGVGLVEGGTLTILRQMLRAASESGEHKVVALVNDRRLVDPNGCCGSVEFVEYSWPKRSWALRIFFELVYSYVLSWRFRPDVWLCAQDITAVVRAPRQYVYCHNPSIFYRASLAEARHDWKFFVFSRLYGLAYRLNIRRNTGVFVQQEWIAQRFREIFKIDNVVVARPESDGRGGEATSSKIEKGREQVVSEKLLFYPALPRVFKNFEVLVQAVRLLRDRGRDLSQLKIVLTIAAGENSYAEMICGQIAGDSCFRLVGRLPREQVDSYYESCDAVIFPSKLETWGLPITEAKAWQKPIFLSDVPYAHETLGTYSRVAFFDPTDGAELARLLGKWLDGEMVFGHHECCVSSEGALEGWDKFVEFL